MEKFEPDIEAITLIPSDGGRFEITVNDRLLYSKLNTHRHVEPGEVFRLITQYQKEGNR